MPISTASLSGRRILIAEDDYFICEEMVQQFQGLGAVVIGPVADVTSALATVTAGEPLDAAVLDINLQGEMVFPVADALRERQVPFVFATGYEHWSVLERFRDVVLCEKPVGPQTMAKALFG